MARLTPAASLPLKSISAFGLESIPEVRSGDDLARLILESCRRGNFALTSGDIVVITSKIVSKAEGNVVDLEKVKPRRMAKAVARLTGKNPVEVEVILGQSTKISAVIPMKKMAKRFPEIFDSLSSDRATVSRMLDSLPSMLVAVTKQGLLATDAGVDYSNNPLGKCSLLPSDSHASAKRISEVLSKSCGGHIPVIITDTEIAYTHLYGSTQTAIGFSGISPVARRFATKDRFGREKFGGADVVVDELACTAALLMGQTSEGVPVVIVRGLSYPRDDNALSSIPPEAISAGFRAVLFSTLKLRLARLLSLFM